MRLGKLASIASLSALALCAPRPATADEGSTLLAGLSMLALTVGADVAFTAYDVARVRDGAPPDLGWMTAQTTLTVPQSVALNVAVAAAAADEDDAPLALLAVPVASWTTSLAGFGVWSMVDDQGDLGDRYGTTWLVGMNTAFTSAALGAAVDERFSSPWIAVPTVLATGPEAVYAAVRAARDDERDPGAWIAMSAWAGLLTVHGVVSIFDAALSEESDDLEIVYPPEPEGDLVVPDAPPGEDEDIEILPPAPKPSPTPPPLVVPSPVTDGAQIVPGLVLTGRF